MKKLAKYLIHILFCLSASAALSQQTAPPGGMKVLGPYPMMAFNLNVSSGAAELKRIEIAGQTFTEVLEINTQALANNPWEIQLQAFTKHDVEIEDVMLLTFWARMIRSTDETGQALAGCVMEKAGPDYDKSLWRSISVGREWKQFFLPFIMKESYDPGKAQVNFQLGTKPQTIQIAAIELFNYRKKLTLDKLPKTEYTYPGREPDAPWRKQAAANIEKYRKGDIEFQILDKKGNPVPNVTVNVQMKKHEFGWGTAVDAGRFQNNAKYRQEFYRNFNKMVFENDMKWPDWNTEFIRNRMWQVLDSMNARGIDARGHCLVWPSWRWLPGDLRQYEKDATGMQKAILNHIQDEAGQVGDKVKEWDVLNEPYTNTDVMKLCGDQVMAEWFTEARKVTPNTKLYINDFSIIEGGGNDIAHQDHYYNTIKYLVDKGAPVQGIGFQSHFAWALTSPEKTFQILDRYAAFGLDMQVTEFDLDIDDEQLQADYTRDFMTMMFSYPQMKGFVIWGFWQGAHWRPDGAMYRSDWSEKPNLKVWQDLIYKTWWTSEKGLSNAQGNYSLRGFYGDYEYTLSDAQGKTLSTGTFQLTKGGFKNKIIVK